MKTAIIFASGSSLTQEDVDFCRGKGFTIAINDCYKLAPWSDVLYACDYQWWDFHRDALNFAGEKWTIIDKAAEDFKLNHIDYDPDLVFSFDNKIIASGNNSGFQALNLAVILGYTRVILLGYDMKLSDSGKRHWFGEHPQKLQMNSNYKLWITKFNAANKLLVSNGIEVINCSRDSALDCFTKMDLQEALCRVEN